MKAREVIPHIGPILIVIPLKLFLDDINFPADNVTARALCGSFVKERKCSKFCTMAFSDFKIEFYGLINFIVCKIQVSNIYTWNCSTV